MTKKYCDICGKVLQNKVVSKNTDPLDYYYGEFNIEFDYKLQGGFELHFEDICHECAKKIHDMSINDFKEFIINKILGTTKME